MAKGLWIRLANGLAAARAIILLFGIVPAAMLSAGNGSASDPAGPAEDRAPFRFILDAGLVPAAIALTQEDGNGTSPVGRTEAQPSIEPRPVGDMAQGAGIMVRPGQRGKPQATGPPAR